MKLFLFSLLLISFFACSNNSTAEGEATKTNEKNAEAKDEAGGNIKTKEDFILTCHIDASNALGSEHQAQVDQFCECAYEKTGGHYVGEIIANDSKLEKDPTLKSCYEEARKK